MRVEIYPEVADLARVSTLTLKEIETSGTIALCKYNRLMIVSPRALIAGYPWRDTLNHEYTHYVVTRVSHNTVPIWLHEGIAKFEERRWRGPSGGGLTPVMEHLLATGIAHKHLITFAQMHPSMAKLPSQEDTALAFAEVYTVVDYLHEQSGWAGVRALIKRFADGKRPGGKSSTAIRPSSSRRGATWLRGKQAAHASGPVAGRDRAALQEGRGQADRGERGRLGAHRRGAGAQVRAHRRHAARAPSAGGGGDRVREGAGDRRRRDIRRWRTSWRAPISSSAIPARAIAAAEPELELYPDQAAPNATLGEAWLRQGDNKKAAQYLEAALAINPFDPAVHCGLGVRPIARSGDARADAEAGACQTVEATSPR